jgi:hypothetical protein
MLGGAGVLWFDVSLSVTCRLAGLALALRCGEGPRGISATPRLGFKAMPRLLECFFEMSA